jgi:hypothetical protein
MRIAIIDGQGGGLGKTLVSSLRIEFEEKAFITALGCNPYASKTMFKAGASEAIWGEKNILSFLSTKNYDCIVGPIGIILPGGIQGDITPTIAEAIFNVECPKYLIPLKMHGIYIPGTSEMSIKELIQNIIDEIKRQP